MFIFFKNKNLKDRGWLQGRAGAFHDVSLYSSLGNAIGSAGSFKASTAIQPLECSSTFFHFVYSIGNDCMAFSLPLYIHFEGGGGEIQTHVLVVPQHSRVQTRVGLRLERKMLRVLQVRAHDVITQSSDHYNYFHQKLKLINDDLSHYLLTMQNPVSPTMFLFPINT